MKRIGIVARPDRPDAADVVRGLTRWLADRGRDVVLDQGTAALARTGASAVDRSTLAAQVDLVVVLGGDGTLLGVVRDVGALGTPILGVNLGGLGFLTATTLEALYPTLEAVLGGGYAVEERMVLGVALRRAGTARGEFLGLNDVVIAKGAPGRLIELEVWADGEPMTAYRADGLIIATPTGSTAYNLSAAGPILFPTMDAVVLTPICSHALTNRPIVLPGTAALEVTLLSDTAGVLLSVDGQAGPSITPADVVAIRRSSARIRLIRDPQKSYFQVLRTKLKWGER